MVPTGWKNLAFTGQFCELADDVVFTIEYSVRSAQTAVYSLLGLRRQPPAVYKEPYDPHILHEAFRALRNTKMECRFCLGRRLSPQPETRPRSNCRFVQPSK